MNQFIFIWAPYQDQPGERAIIDLPFAGTTQEAINLAINNRDKWRLKYGDGQVIITRVSTYLGLH